MLKLRQIDGRMIYLVASHIEAVSAEPDSGGSRIYMVGSTAPYTVETSPETVAKLIGLVTDMVVVAD